MNKIYTAIIFLLGIIVGCDLLPNTVVWIQNIGFFVDKNANNGVPFVSHLVVVYNDALKEQVSAMDSRTYFNSIDKLRKSNKNIIEVFEYDIIPGKVQMNQRVKLKSYAKAKGAYIFAKYTNPGKFMEDIGSSPVVVVKCLPHKIELANEKEISNLSKR